MLDEQLAADAWLDLARVEQQRVAATLVTSVENATVLLATLTQQHEASQALDEPMFATRATQNAHVAVRNVQLPAHAHQQQTLVVFPSATLTPADIDGQRFALSLQQTDTAALPAQLAGASGKFSFLNYVRVRERERELSNAKRQSLARAKLENFD